MSDSHNPLTNASLQNETTERMAPAPQLSPRAAVAVGLFCAACGIVPTLVGLGVIQSSETDAPPWVVASAGVMFILAGAAVIVGYAVAGGEGADGDLPAGTPFGVRLAQSLLGLAIIGLMAAIASWIAFGPGDRHFSSVLALPFGTRVGESSDIGGRIAFGIGAVLMWMMLVSFVVVSVRRLIRSRAGR